MKVIGITGGIGSGKTTVCRIFEQLGVPVYYADDRAKMLMNTSATLREGIITEFGSEAYTDQGLNRAYLAGLVFSTPERLAKLNALVHPAVADDFDEWVEQHAKEPYVMKEAAILFESGAYQGVDITVLVIAPEDIRIERVVGRDGVMPDDVRKRLANQWTQERKAKLADHIINNDGFHLLIPQVLELHRKFTEV